MPSHCRAPMPVVAACVARCRRATARTPQVDTLRAISVLRRKGVSAGRAGECKARRQAQACLAQLRRAEQTFLSQQALRQD